MERGEADVLLIRWQAGDEAHDLQIAVAGTARLLSDGEVVVVEVVVVP